MGVYKKCHGFLSINAQIAQYLSTHQISFFLLQFWALILFLCKHMQGQSILVKIQQKSKTCKVRNASCRFWKIYNFQIFGHSTDTGQVVEGRLILWLGFLETHKYLEYFQRIFITQICPKCSEDSLVKHVFVVFSNANISLDLYLRFLSKNEYLGLNCMWWRSLLIDLG